MQPHEYVILEIARERERQINTEGWTPPHDDAHRQGEMAGAAACYIMHGLSIGKISLRHQVQDVVRDLWPWALHWWKPSQRRRDLIKAAALVVA